MPGFAKRVFAPTNGVPMTRDRVNVRRDDKVVNHIAKMMSKQFPGTQEGATVEAVREFIRNQARKRGFRLSGGAGTTIEHKIDISGSAKFILGHMFPINFDADVTFMINEEEVEKKVAVANLVPSINPRGTTDWFIINRPLAGQDDVTLTIKAFEAYDNIPYTIYFI
jgi:hypothetical protein